MRRLLCFLAAFFLVGLAIANSQPFGPPLYIADPDSMKCRYYFSGDKKHFNPRPENYTIDIGYTTDFKSDAHACEFFRCVYTNGTVKVDETNKPVESELCICPENTYWDEAFGCVKIKQPEKPITFLKLIWEWVKGLFI